MDVVPCAGAVVHDVDGRLLLVRRGRAPGRGLWSVPGGRLRPGETTAQAAAREVLEETGLVVEVAGVLGVVERGEYVITDHLATPVGGRLRPGDDADEARWVTAAELAALPLVPLLAETLAGWSALPDRRRAAVWSGHDRGPEVPRSAPERQGATVRPLGPPHRRVPGDGPIGDGTGSAVPARGHDRGGTP